MVKKVNILNIYVFFSLLGLISVLFLHSFPILDDVSSFVLYNTIILYNATLFSFIAFSRISQEEMVLKTLCFASFILLVCVSASYMFIILSEIENKIDLLSLTFSSIAFGFGLVLFLAKLYQKELPSGDLYHHRSSYIVYNRKYRHWQNFLNIVFGNYGGIFIVVEGSAFKFRGKNLIEKIYSHDPKLFCLEKIKPLNKNDIRQELLGKRYSLFTNNCMQVFTKFKKW